MKGSARACTWPLVAGGVLALGAAASPVLGFKFTLSLSAPAPVVGQPMIIQATGTDPPATQYPFLSWLTVVAIPATVVSTCPTGYVDATQVATQAGGEILAIASRENPDAAGNFTNSVGYTPEALGAVLVCAYTNDGLTDTFATASLLLNVLAEAPRAPSTTTTTPPPTTATSLSSTTGTTLPLTSSTTLPGGCTSARCAIDGAVHGAACMAQAVPRPVTRRLDTAVHLVERAEGSPPKKAARLRKRARSLLALAGKAATNASKGKKPKLTVDCATAIRGAADSIRRALGG